MADAKAQNRYRVIERLESGGMAEVFRGEAESLAGFKKPVAIKRVLPHLAQNEKFIRMFLDEARLCARLNHANIVQVFDIGHVENTYFIVMEFVDGVNLKGVVEHTRKRSATMPIPAAVHIAMEICKGLQYAHDLTDSDGILLNIVHRDMSPPNVLISKRGEVKIVDFGLAKAAMQVEKTDPGVVKGKFSYLAPETAMGNEADPQADIFAVGIMLWEMLSGRRLFLGDSDYQTVKLVQQANIPSLRKLNPDVPESLEVVIMRSLARDKRGRFATAEDFNQDLAQFLFSHQMRVTGFDIAKIVREVVEEKRAARKDVRQDASIIDRLIQEELLRFTSLENEIANAIEKQGSSPLDPSSLDDGSKPLTPDQFIDVGNWAREIGDFDPTSSSGSGWREPAQVNANLASELEGDDLSPPQSPPPSPPPVNSSTTADARTSAVPHGGSLDAGDDLATDDAARSSLARRGPSKNAIVVGAVVAVAGVGTVLLWALGAFGH
jgi:serine/threonine protein kinase